MEDKSIILNEEIEASSTLSPKYREKYARLHKTSGEGCWVPHPDDSHPFLQVDFLETKGIIGIYTQGCSGILNYVKSYNVSYSNDGVNFQHILGQNGNTKVRSAVEYSVVGWSGLGREWCGVESSKRGVVLRAVQSRGMVSSGVR